MPRVELGDAGCPALPVVKEKRVIRRRMRRPPSIVIRQPVHRELFSLPWHGRRRRAGHWAVHRPMVPATLSSGFGPEGPRTRRFISRPWRRFTPRSSGTPHARSHRLRVAEQRTTALRAEAMKGIIAQLGKCRITFPEIFLRALNLLGRLSDCVPDGVGRRCKSRRCHTGRKRVSAEEPGPKGLRVPLSRDGSRLSAALRPG